MSVEWWIYNIHIIVFELVCKYEVVVALWRWVGVVCNGKDSCLVTSLALVLEIRLSGRKLETFVNGISFIKIISIPPDTLAFSSA